MKIIKQLIIVILVFTIYACESCKQQSLSRGQEEGLVELTTTSVSTVGSINTSKLVIELTGKITKNLINGNSQINIIIIPENTEIKGAASEFRTVVERSPLDKNNPFLSLPSNTGLVYYGSDIAPGKNGTIVEKIFLQDKLSAGDYKAYLVVHNKEHGTYYSIKGKDINIPDIASSNSVVKPTITLQNTKATRKINHITNTASIDITAAADVANHTPELSGGFVFIEKDPSVTATIENVVISYINNSSVPTNTAFEKSAMNPGVIIRSFSTAIANNNNLAAEDTTNTFRKGAIYKVYAYIVDTASNYIISSEDKEIIIPKPEVELEMKGAEITKMIYDVGNLASNSTLENIIKFKLKGEISKHEGTSNPNIGFLLVKDLITSSEEAMEKVKKLLQIPSTGDGLHIDMPNVSLCYTENINTNKTGEISINKLLSLPAAAQSLMLLDKTLYIYFWLKDGADVFVSDPENVTELHIPKAKLTVNQYETSYAAVMLGLKDQLQVASQFSTTAYDKQYMGFLLVREQNPPIAISPTQVFDRILQDAVTRSDIDNTAVDTNDNLIRSEKNPSAALIDIGSNPKEVLYYWHDKKVLDEVESKLDMEDGVNYKVWPWYTNITENHKSIFYEEITDPNKFFECFTLNHKDEVILVSIPHDAKFAIDTGLGLTEVTSFEVSNPESEAIKKKIDSDGANSKTYFIKRIQPDNINPLLDINNADDANLIKVILENRFYRGKGSAPKVQQYIDFMSIPG